MTKTNNIFCEFTYIGDNNYICPKCNLRITINDQNPEPPMFPCSAIFETQNIQDIKDLASNAIENIILCEDAEVARRLSICKNCEYYSNNVCSKCGCLLMNTKAFAGKLSQKEQACPINKW